MSASQPVFYIRTTGHDVVEIKRNDYESDADFYKNVWKLSYGVDIESASGGLTNPFQVSSATLARRISFPPSKIASSAALGALGASASR